jgi:hypothetical protein
MQVKSKEIFKMKIIFCKWGSICEQGIYNAMKRLGHTVIEFTRKFENVDYDKAYAEELIQ